ncbi:MAG: cell division protein FtsQ/DivIB [Proteobacteria bacterium]|nr:cell division protein FtsQ/DivIB [Pseudomonadota bacterium]
MSSSQKKIHNFFLTNPFLRRARVFFSRFLKPFLLKILLALALLLILVFFSLQIFKPDFLHKIYAESRNYFFSQLSLEQKDLAQINIKGNLRVSKNEIEAIINESKKNNPEFLIQKLIKDIKTKLPWINQITITRSLPSGLNITVTEFVPFAIWQNDGKKYLIDRDGNIIPFEDLEEFRDMIILSGKGANTNVRSIFNIFAIDPNLSKNVFSATWVGDRRWDIHFENGLLIKLPESGISEAWQRLIKINNMPGSLLGLKVIDLRVPDKIYLEYNDSVIKELKNL